MKGELGLESRKGEGELQRKAWKKQAGEGGGKGPGGGGSRGQEGAGVRMKRSEERRERRQQGGVQWCFRENKIMMKGLRE